jgi:hypothetical protein
MVLQLPAKRYELLNRNIKRWGHSGVITPFEAKKVPVKTENP